MEFEIDNWYWLATDDRRYLPIYFNNESQFKIDRGVYLSLEDFKLTFADHKITKAIMPT